MSPELLHAILSMDSYNRGYFARIELGDPTDLMGATIIDPSVVGVGDSKIEEWIAAGFFAQAYRVGGETIISYRGTDSFLPDIQP